MVFNQLSKIEPGFRNTLDSKGGSTYPLFIPLGSLIKVVYTPFGERGMNISKPFAFIYPRGMSKGYVQALDRLRVYQAIEFDSVKSLGVHLPPVGPNFDLIETFFRRFCGGSPNQNCFFSLFFV